MSVLGGHYVITNRVRDRPVGLGLVDPGAPLPVLTFPKESPEPTGPRVFRIKNIAEDKYKLTFIDGPERVVGMKSDEELVWAFGPLVPQPASDEWKVTHIPQHGKDAYLIETPDKSGKGWVASEEDDAQVTVKPLIAYMSFPAKYPDTEIFDIVLLYEYDKRAEA